MGEIKKNMKWKRFGKLHFFWAIRPPIRKKATKTDFYSVLGICEILTQTNEKNQF